MNMKKLLLLAVVVVQAGCASHNPPVTHLDPDTFRASCEWNMIQQRLLQQDIERTQAQSRPDLVRVAWAKNNLWALRSSCGQ
jgi:hypothetical protein